MVLRTDELIHVITTLSDDSGLRVTVSESVKGGLIAGTACTIGGLVFGPPGLAVGGAIGGCIAYLIGDGKFKPVSKVILYEMKEEDRRLLVQSVSNIVRDLDVSDGAQLLVLINGNLALKGRIVAELTNFFQDQLSLHVL